MSHSLASDLSVDLLSHVPFKNLVRVKAWPKGGLTLPQLQAHRGYWISGCQENTLAAIQMAHAQGAHMFECDVQLSRDRIPVLCHDSDIKRISGIEAKVSELTARELLQKAHVPSLQQVLTDPYCPRLANIELKTSEVLDDPLERKVCEVVEKVQAQSRVLFSSFNPFSIFRLSLFLPDVPRALLVTYEEHEDNSSWLRELRLAPFFSFHMLNLDHHNASEEEMQFWKKKNVPVALWTVNGSEKIKKYLDMGAVSIISDTL